MKHLSNIAAFTLTAITLKGYMLIAIMWSKSSERYNSILLRMQAPFLSSAAPQTA